MKEVIIASACRTAIGAFGGTLKGLNGAVLASTTMQEAISRAGIDPSIIDESVTDDELSETFIMPPVFDLTVSQRVAEAFGNLGGFFWFFAFMFGLAFGRAVSIVVDGVPSTLLVVYTVLEITMGVWGVLILKKLSNATGA